MSSPLLLILAGPSGSGKSTLCDRLAASEPGFARVVTSTTRTPREGEIDGVHYHFFSPAEFDVRTAKGEFLEWAWVHGERRYGTLATSVLAPLAEGRDLVLSVDVQGVANFRRAAETNPAIHDALVTVFIRVDRERLMARMRLRGQDDDAEIARRMATAEAELQEADAFDWVIEGKTRDEDYAALLAIVRAERAARR